MIREAFGHYLFADTKVSNHVSDQSSDLTSKHRKYKNFLKFSAILLIEYLIPHASLYFCAFGPWQLLMNLIC